jgi:hypothetical protein
VDGVNQEDLITGQAYSKALCADEALQALCLSYAQP